ncbi:MAG TPA: hypothetical protein PKE29_17825 [Phycisphaerales bacterium]|nr:hypothetical protein [Phycisphaerales bacterium]
MGHEYQDACSLEMARQVAAGLPLHPEWITLARTNLARWRERNADAPSLLRCYDEWAMLLDLPIPQICAILTAQTDEAQRLRQNTPFAGVLSPQEVWEIKRRLRHDQTAA